MLFLIYTRRKKMKGPKQYLHSHLGCHGRVNNCSQLMSSEDTEWVGAEVQHRDELVVANALEASQGHVAFLMQGDVVTRDHDWVTHELPEDGMGVLILVFRERRRINSFKYIFIVYI